MYRLPFAIQPTLVLAAKLAHSTRWVEQWMRAKTHAALENCSLNNTWYKYWLSGNQQRDSVMIWWGGYQWGNEKYYLSHKANDREKLATYCMCFAKWRHRTYLDLATGDGRVDCCTDRQHRNDERRVPQKTIKRTSTRREHALVWPFACQMDEDTVLL